MQLQHFLCHDVVLEHEKVLILSSKGVFNVSVLPLSPCGFAYNVRSRDSCTIEWTTFYSIRKKSYVNESIIDMCIGPILFHLLNNAMYFSQCI